MTSTEYTINSIRELVEKFPKIKCSHAYNEHFSTHYVEISPKSEFDFNEGISDFLDEIFFRFTDSFPNECIAFSTEDAIFPLEAPSYVLVGDEYDIEECVVWHSIDELIAAKPDLQIFESQFDYFTFDNEYSIAA